jgi:hypothetical protein
VAQDTDDISVTAIYAPIEDNFKGWDLACMRWTAIVHAYYVNTEVNIPVLLERQIKNACKLLHNVFSETDASNAFIKLHANGDFEIVSNR